MLEEKSQRRQQKLEDREGELTELKRQRREVLSCLEKLTKKEGCGKVVEEEVQLRLSLASDNDLFSLVGWEFGTLPRPRTHYELPTALPPSLRELLQLQPALLRQLSHVKLRILARAFRGVYPDESEGLSEDDLYDCMQAAIQSVVSLDWQPSPPMPPKTPARPNIVHWEEQVSACVSHWLSSWARGSKG
ncbi:g4430 [Coccomyxa viridis]|uniref:G4430 protein n=1 Tax=Coccomyxa viridis TaxID=1274662 RepID=A0ABP1FQ93_9CHLO